MPAEVQVTAITGDAKVSISAENRVEREKCFMPNPSLGWFAIH
jgi:hypothetical protein